MTLFPSNNLLALARAILISCCFVAYAQSPPQNWRDIADQLRQEQSTARQQGEYALQAWRDRWIPRLETALEQDPAEFAPLVPELARLHLDRGDFARAEQLYAEAFYSGNFTPANRIDYGILASHAAIQEGASVDEIKMYYADLFDTADLVDILAGQSATELRQRRALLPRQYAEHLFAVAARLTHNVQTPSGSELRSYLENVMYANDTARAAVEAYLQAFQAGVAAGPNEPQWIHDLASRMSSLDQALAVRLERAGEVELSQEFYQNSTVLLYETIDLFGLKNTPDLNLSLLLRGLYESSSRNTFLSEAERFLADMTPGHGILTFLVSTAINASNSDDQLGLSNQIFSLITAAERSWFPDEYEQHVNWQWSMIRAAHNALRMGDVESADRLLAELEGVGVQGDSLMQMLQRVRDVREQMVRAGHTRELPDPPKIPIVEEPGLIDSGEPDRLSDQPANRSAHNSAERDVINTVVSENASRWPWMRTTGVVILILLSVWLVWRSRRT